MTNEEINVEVATKIMGWTMVATNGTWIPPGKQPIASGYYTDRPGNFATDIAAAWKIIDAFNASTKLAVHYPDFLCELRKRFEFPWNTLEGWFFQLTSQKAARAICESALSALTSKEPKPNG